MLNKTLFSQMMAMLCELYEKQLTENLSNTYYFILKDLDDSDFKQAVKSMMQSRVYSTMPKPAEIMQYSKPINNIDILTKDNLLESSLVWMKVFRKRGLSENEIANKITEWEGLHA